MSLPPWDKRTLTYTGQKVPWPGMRRACDISKGPRSTQGRGLIRKWFDSCRKSHPECRLAGKSRGLPTRVLDVRPIDSTGQPEPKLVSLKGKKAPYVALSHCWGDPNGTQLPKTTSFNIQSRSSGISMSQLPPTFQDAVVLCRKLKTQYLWIDSLCIIQNDKDDWGSESLQMASIYKNARLVISAAGASNCNAGLFSLRNPPDIYDIAKSDGTRSAVYVRPKTDHQDFTSRKENSRSKCHNPLFTRAWAFQERLAARRVLHFCLDEMVWECNSGIRCECGSLQNTGPLESLKSGQLRLAASRHLYQSLEHWDEVVRQFTRRKLTYNSDRLPALSSLAEQLGSIKLDGYYAGIWGYSLLEGNGLWWRRLPDDTDNSKANVSRTQEYSAPSWSWAACDGEVEFEDPWRGPESRRARDANSDWETRRYEILNVSYTPANPLFPFGSPATGHLTLRVILAPVESNLWVQSHQNKEYETETVFFPDGTTSYQLAAQETSRCFLVKSYDITAGARTGGKRHSFLDRDEFRVDVALVIGRSPRVPGAYDRLGLAVSRTRLPETEYLDPDSEDVNRYAASPPNKRWASPRVSKSIITIV